MSNQLQQQPRRGRGRPRIYEDEAAWLQARRDRHRARRSAELEQVAVWQRVRDAAIARGVLTGHETEPEAMAKVISKIN